jgi:hypothetical protein
VFGSRKRSCIAKSRGCARSGCAHCAVCWTSTDTDAGIDTYTDPYTNYHVTNTHTHDRLAERTCGCIFLNRDVLRCELFIPMIRSARLLLHGPCSCCTRADRAAEVRSMLRCIQRARLLNTRAFRALDNCKQFLKSVIAQFSLA